MLTCPDCGGVVELGLTFGHGTDTTPHAECTECQNTWNQWGEKE